MAAVEQHITYRRELRAGDVISVYSDIISLRQRVLIFRHRMLGGGSSEPAAETEITGVHLDLTTRRAAALPKDVIRNSRALMKNASSPRPEGAPHQD
jgi:acyl-CoA thioester hydrolase